MLKAIALIAIGATYRLMPHPWNAVPMGALSLYAGARLSRRQAWLVPILAMAISDLVLDYGTGRPVFTFSRWLVYGAFAATTLLGPLANRPKVGPFALPALSLAGSLCFFLTTNFAWAWFAAESTYPHTLRGILDCYLAGLPFFDKTVMADLVGTAVLFGLDAAFVRVRGLNPHRRPTLAPAYVQEADPKSAS